MNVSTFTPGQRRVLMVMILLIVVVFAALSGFIITSLQRPQTPTPFASTVETPAPPTSPPVVATSLPTLTPEPQEGIWSQVQLARLLDQVGRRVETLRGLTPQTEVPLNFLSDRDMSVLLRQVYVDRDLEGHLLPYTALGLLPDEPVVLRIPQVVGVYVPEQGQLYLASGQQDVSEQDRVVLPEVDRPSVQEAETEELQLLPTPTRQVPPPAAPTEAPQQVCVACPRGLVNDPYPGRCRRYVDANGNGVCDLSEPGSGSSC